MFRVRLNQSYDDSSPPIYERFPEDSSLERSRQLHFCDEAAAVTAMWRNGKVPQWADLSVIGEQNGATLIEVLVCGRFTADESILYHVREGIAPFHSVGPTLPPGWERGTRFSIHLREECWDLPDVQRLATFSESVWSLALFTDELDSRHLVELPALPRMEVLEHHRCALGSKAFQAFSRFAALRVVRLWLTEGSQFSIGEEAVCPMLTDLAINGLGDWNSRLDQLAAAAPGLRALTLEGPGQLFNGGGMPEKMPLLTGLRSLHLAMPNMTEAGIGRLMSGMPSLESLGLRGTAVGDEFAERVVQHWSLGYLDLVGTEVSEAKVRELSLRYPDLKIFPRLIPQAAEGGASA